MPSTANKTPASPGLVPWWLAIWWPTQQPVGCQMLGVATGIPVENEQPLNEFRSPFFETTESLQKWNRHQKISKTKQNNKKQMYQPTYPPLWLPAVTGKASRSSSFSRSSSRTLAAESVEHMASLNWKWLNSYHLLKGNWWATVTSCGSVGFQNPKPTKQLFAPPGIAGRQLPVAPSEVTVQVLLNERIVDVPHRSTERNRARGNESLPLPYGCSMKLQRVLLLNTGKIIIKKTLKTNR